jgi:DNA integrity scanning protein DisA with diadenylate cyclase activity
MKKKVEEILIEIALKIAKQKKGCIFVIEDKPIKYNLLMEQDIKTFNILDNQQRRIETLAMMDGAVIISPEGDMKAYAAQIANVKPYTNFGLRHSSAYTASLPGNTVILASEEDAKVRIFKNGKLVMQLDALEKNIQTKTSDAVSILESIGVGTLGTIGASLMVPTLGLSLIPGILIFGTSHYLIKQLNQTKN